MLYSQKLDVSKPKDFKMEISKNLSHPMLNLSHFKFQKSGIFEELILPKIQAFFHSRSNSSERKVENYKLILKTPKKDKHMKC